MDLVGNHKLFEELNKKVVAHRSRRITLAKWSDFLYLAVRVLRPDVVVETGVFDGQSSAVILQALRDNERGQLVSIDLPATRSIVGSTHWMSESTLPPGQQPGWAIPDYLRDRHHLVLGDSREKLPQVLANFPRIDMFLHDSLHTYEHQSFEYALAWSHLTPGGLLLSDDFLWSAAFHEFCEQRAQKYVNLGSCAATRK